MKYPLNGVERYLDKYWITFRLVRTRGLQKGLTVALPNINISYRSLIRKNELYIFLRFRMENTKIKLTVQL